MERAREGGGHSRERALAVVAVTGFVLVVALQCLRAFFPIIYTYRESSGLTNAAAVGILVFVAPVLAPLWLRVAGRRAMVMIAVLLGALRLAMQASSTFGIALAAVAAAVGLVAVGVVVLAARDHGAELVLGVVLGLTLDTVIRAGWATWDLTWQDGALAWVVAAALVGALVVASWVAARDAPEVPPHRALLAGLALGPFLALQMLVLQNPAFVSSSGDAALATGVAVVIAADAVALGALGLVLFRCLPRLWLVGATAALSVLAWWATNVTGTGVVAVVLVGQALAVLLLACVLVAPEPTESRPSFFDALGLAAGSLIFGLLVVGYQLHYDEPLPVTNRWLPVVAAVLLGTVAIVISPSTVRADADHRDARRVGWVAVSVALVGALLFGALARSEPALTRAAVHPGELTVMTYNVHETVSRNGHLDPAALAYAVRQVRPDVLIVEEAGRGWPLSAGLDLAEWAKRRLDLPYVWVPAADEQFGNVLFSRAPVRSARIVELPHADGSMKRSAVVARVGPVDGATVTLIGTHLQNGEAPDRAQARIDELHAIVRAAGRGTHTVIAGDLNSDPASPELQVLLDAGYVTTQPTGACTLKTSNQNCVDWIFVSPDLRQTKVRTLAVDTYDHRPLVSTVRPGG